MMPRQSLPSVYIRSGDIYAIRRQCVVEQHSLIGNCAGALVIDPEFAVNIDTPLDLEIAKIKLSAYQASL